MVGIYLSSHPLDAYKFEMNHFTSHTLEQATYLYEKASWQKNSSTNNARRRNSYASNIGFAKKQRQAWVRLPWKIIRPHCVLRFFGKDYEQFTLYERNEILLVRCSLQERFNERSEYAGPAADRNPVTSPVPFPRI